MDAIDKKKHALIAAVDLRGTICFEHLEMLAENDWLSDIHFLLTTHFGQCQCLISRNLLYANTSCQLVLHVIVY